MHKIHKAVFPVAGFGTRFLPATTPIPTELMPVIDKSLIHYAVEETIAAGMDPPGTITVLNTASVSARNIQIYTF